MPGEIWVVIEQLGNKIETVSLELLGEAFRLGKTLKAISCAVVLGPQGFLTRKIQQELIQYGAQKIYVAEDIALESYQSEVFTEALTQAVKAKNPLAILIGATPNGNDFAPRVATRIGAGLVSNCTDIKTNAGGRLVFIKQIFNGKAQATCIAAGQTQIATVKPDVIGLDPAVPTPKDVNVDIERLAFRLTSLCHRVKTLEFIKGDPATIDIAEADIIVAGGKGIGGKEKWGIIEALASAVGGSIAGSRMAMDLGCIERERLVGQTGKTVSPKLYIALGISGAIQHVAGLKKVDKIIAINKDKKAPIMQRANLGVVADAHELAPVLIKKLKSILKPSEEGCPR